MNPSSVVTKTLKLVLNYLQRVEVVVLRSLGTIDFPVPPNSSMRKTQGSGSIRHYYVSGIQSALPIATAALREGVGLGNPIRILDFGCGVGRQLLHMTRHYPVPEYHACDIDETSIAFVESAYPQVAAYTNDFYPPLRYHDSFFDMVYSVSIFSHLSIDDQRGWLAELARIIRPGGLCLLTVEGRKALDPLQVTFGMDRHALSRVLEHNGYLYAEYAYLQKSVARQDTLKETSLLVGVDGSYGNMVLSPEYVRENWDSDLFEVVAILEGVIDFRQDLVLLRRR